ncbi:unnamed protein product, partial [Coccothraustes coccothraustes]
MRCVIVLCLELQGKDMYLILENDMLNLIDPMDRTVLHAQPIVSIRVCLPRCYFSLLMHIAHYSVPGPVR